MKLADLALRARAIERAITESCCRVEPMPWGAFVSNAEFSRVHMANCAWVDRWPQGQEVEDFVDFLKTREPGRAPVDAAARLSDDAFRKVWDNPDDAEYDRL